ncbi:MAG: ribosomal-processing cysteine protease Prp [Treponema sp.]|uniref:ribosomal-processing cysteine protease Prp n=1 Tax=Treponema sp. TaxID=166 RepID=UPI0025F2276F|nr:ribosomal-processing cysteine protease Prp [Treponema sp.]MBR0494702.1 ribosomal-processing cysteine protease Prp [Treponema sp.]
MTVVALSYGKNGAIKKCQANGHADFSKKGTDIVCAAITILIRTAMQVLSHTENVLLIADASARGTLSFSVEAKTESPETEAQLKCIGDFLRTGIKALTKEFPENVILMEE